MTDYTEIKRLADKSKDSWVNGKWHTRPTLDIGVDEDDSAYIAAASPDVVLSMIAEIDRLRTQNQALREALKDVSDEFPFDWAFDSEPKWIGKDHYRSAVKNARALISQAEGGV